MLHELVEDPTDHRPAHHGLAVAALVVALSAFVGAAELAGGGLSLGSKLNARLPFHSPVVGAIALALIVGVPFTVLALRAWYGDRRTGQTSFVAGVALLGWLLVELAFVREFSLLQVIYGVIGAAFIEARKRL